MNALPFEDHWQADTRGRKILQRYKSTRRGHCSQCKPR
jgi:hypothetical protein